MINSKADLKYYLEEDRKAFGKPLKNNLKDIIIHFLFPDTNYEYVKCIRYLEYYKNSRQCGKWGGMINSLLIYYYEIRKTRLRAITGIELQEGCTGAGLHIAHGKIVVQHEVTIGEHCKILSDVTIGINGRKDVYGVPTIGNNVFIGTGARIIGPIHIGNNVVIGANAVVIDDVEDGVTVAGIPARKVSERGSESYYLCAIN